MVGRFTTDILVEGNGLTAASLAYYLSKYNTDKDITLLLNESSKNAIPFITPGVILPIFEFNSSLIEKFIKKTSVLLEDLHSITSLFELSKNPLAILYRGKESLEMRDKHIFSIAETNLKHINYESEDISNYYPFINTESEIYLTEIYKSLTCSDCHNLISAFQSLAEENNVQIIRESKNYNFKKESATIESTDITYDSREYSFITSPSLFSNNDIQTFLGMKITTPIIEKFPRTSIYDIETGSIMWLEEAGYFQIFRLSKEKDIKKSEEELEKIFLKLFPRMENLEIVETTSEEITSISNVLECLRKLDNTNVFQFSIPIQYEITMAPILSKNISSLISRQEKEILKKPSIESLLLN